MTYLVLILVNFETKINTFIVAQKGGHSSFRLVINFIMKGKPSTQSAEPQLNQHYTQSIPSTVGSSPGDVSDRH